MTRGKIDKPGVYKLSMVDYHGQPCIGPSISSSGLRTIFLESPAHYWCESSLNPERIEPKDTEAFVLGRAAHHLLLGEDDFSTLFIVRPDELADKPWHGNRTECKAWLAKQRDEGRTVLTQEQINSIRGMARSLASHELIKSGILNGKIEQSLIWQDKPTGLWLKSRPDAIPTDSGDMADLKCTSNIGFRLDSDVFKYRYDLQATLAKWAAKEVLGLELTSFSFVFVESKPPHSVDVLSLGHEEIAEAEQDLRVAMDTFAYCLRSGDWFAPSGSQSDARWIHKSEFVRKDAEFRRDFLRREITATTGES